MTDNGPNVHKSNNRMSMSRPKDWPVLAMEYWTIQSSKNGDWTAALSNSHLGRSRHLGILTNLARCPSNNSQLGPI